MYTLFYYPTFFAGMWSVPIVSGTRPPPCRGFSLTMLDNHRAVLFGGSQPSGHKSNDVYILDLAQMVSWLCIMASNFDKTLTDGVNQVAESFRTVRNSPSGVFPLKC
jgi:hypothetical protein